MATNLPFSHEIELSGHIIDSLILPHVWDVIMRSGCNFDVQEFRVGRTSQEQSYIRMAVLAPTPLALREVLSDLEQVGAEIVGTTNVQTHIVDMEGILPDDFYATTNLPTDVRINDEWVPVAGIEMDVAIVVDREQHKAFCKPMHVVHLGEEVVIGQDGIRVHPLERTRETEEVFSFMQNSVSSERSKGLVIRDIAREMFNARQQGGKILLVLGPAIVHTGAREYIEELIEMGYVQVIFAGNAVAAHDCEAALFGTSLGVDLQTGDPVRDGHRNHLRAINTIRRHGSLQQAYDAGILKNGIMAASIKHHVRLVLAASIRDDGPIPDVQLNMREAQNQMRSALDGVEVALMLASMLHGIATGNMLPATIRTVVVDINHAVVTKLADRGTTQAIGLVTDVELFLRELVDHLKSHSQKRQKHSAQGRGMRSKENSSVL